MWKVQDRRNRSKRLRPLRLNAARSRERAARVKDDPRDQGCPVGAEDEEGAKPTAPVDRSRKPDHMLPQGRTNTAPLICADEPSQSRTIATHGIVPHPPHPSPIFGRRRSRWVRLLGVLVRCPFLLPARLFLFFGLLHALSLGPLEAVIGFAQGEISQPAAAGLDLRNAVPGRD